MESNIKIKEESIISTPGKQLTPNENDNECDDIPEENISLLLNILEEITIEKPLNKDMNLTEVLHLIFQYEEEMINYIEKESNLDLSKIQILNNFTNDILNQMIDKFSSFKVKDIKTKIQYNFDILLKSINDNNKLFKEYFNFSEDFSVNDNEIIDSIESNINNFQKDYFLQFNETCLNNLDVEIIPNYLLNGYGDKLNSYLLDKISNEYLQNFYEQYKKEQPEVKQMIFFLDNLLTKHIDLFDKKPDSYFTADSIEHLFKIFVISNLSYFENDNISYQIFVCKLKKYSIIMNLPFDFAKNILEFYRSLFISMKVNKNKNSNNSFNYINKIYEDESEFEFEEELKSLFSELKNNLTNEKYFMIVFSFSLMLNNFVLVEFGEVIMNPQISVNARERQFLLNFLLNLKKFLNSPKHYDRNYKKFPFYINSIVESLIAKKFVKHENIKIFGLDENKKKIEISHNMIINSILSSDNKDNEDSISEEKNNKNSENKNEINNNSIFKYFFPNLDNEYISNVESIQRNSNSKDQILYQEISKDSNISMNQNEVNIQSEKMDIQYNNLSNDKDENQELKEIINPYKEQNSNEKSFSENIIDNSKARLELNKRIAKKYHKIKPFLQEESSFKKIVSFLRNYANIGLNPESLEQTKLDIYKIKIRPLNNYIFSLNSSIFFSGFLSEGSNYYNDWKLFKFSIHENKEFNSYEWPAFNYYDVGSQVMQVLSKAARIFVNFKNYNFIGLFKEILDIKNLHKDNIFDKAVKIAKLSGKILAYSIASRNLFRPHSINLIGFSLGCQVIKSFLKELYKLSFDKNTQEFNQELINIIQNVVFIGGAIDFKNTKKWSKIFQTFIAGKIINVYCKGDEILKKLYKIAKPDNNPIGLKRLELIDCNKIENYDMTSKNDGHLSYRSVLDHIMIDIDLEF